MNFWFDQKTTLDSLRNHGMLEQVLNFIVNQYPLMTKDFEVKRLIIGISALLMTPGNIDNTI